MSIKRRQAGLTLVELIMFMVIVGIAVASVMQVLAMSARSSPDPMRRKQALAIAEGLMEEVRLARFTHCDPTDAAAETATSSADCATPEVAGPENPADTRPFDNVNDYVKAYGNPLAYTTDAAGNPFPVGYQATVQISQEAFGPAGAQVPLDGALHITVTVSYNYDNSARTVVLDSYRTRYAPRWI